MMCVDLKSQWIAFGSRQAIPKALFVSCTSFLFIMLLSDSCQCYLRRIFSSAHNHCNGRKYLNRIRLCSSCCHAHSSFIRIFVLLFPDFVLPFPAYVLSFFALLPLELFRHVPNLVRKTSSGASLYDFKRLLIYLDRLLDVDSHMLIVSILPCIHSQSSFQTALAAMFPRCSEDVSRLAIVSDHVAVVTGQGLRPVSAV